MSGELDWVLVGLGNPGGEYRGTRHNVGFMLVDVLRGHCEGQRRVPLKQSTVYEGRLFDARVLLVKPKTFMNRSGDSLPELMRKYEFPTNRMLVILDDVALPLGRIRIKREGSPGGHNGLKSIRSVLDTNAYPRLRIGIKEEVSPEDMSDFVLSPFPKNALPVLTCALQGAAAAVEKLITEGPERSMAVFNGWLPLRTVRERLEKELGEDFAALESDFLAQEGAPSKKRYRELLHPAFPTDPHGRIILPDGTLHDREAFAEADRATGRLRKLRNELIRRKKEEQRRRDATQTEPDPGKDD